MDGKDVIRSSFERAKIVTTLLLSDLSDADIMRRPAPRANHIAWQLGHLIGSLKFFGESITPGSMPDLPENFAQQHAKETAESDDPSAFLAKDQYLALLDTQRAAMLQLLEGLDDAALAADAPEELRAYAPRVVDMIDLAAEHEMMHSGQISVLRRTLEKPVAF